MTKNFNKYKILSIGVIVGFLLSLGGTAILLGNNGIGVYNQAIQNTVKLAIQSELTNNAVNPSNVVLLNDLNKINNITKSTNEKIFEDSAWEAQSEVISKDNLQIRNYRKLKEWILNRYSNDFKNFYEPKDIENFNIVSRNINYSSMDVSNKNGKVEQTLKVYYENKNGDRKSVV